MDSIKTPSNVEQKNKEKDKAFNRLKCLQVLLKKEASLKQIFNKIYKIKLYNYFFS